MEKRVTKAIDAILEVQNPDCTSLVCSFTIFTDQEFAEFLQLLQASKVTSINLTQCQLGEANVKALAEALPNTQLEGLNLTGNGIGPAATEAIATALPKSTILSLDLEGNPLGDDGLAQLAAALPYAQVKALNLKETGISHEGVAALAAVLPDAPLETLNLFLNNMGDEGVNALIAALPTSKLKSLEIGSNGVGDESMPALAAALPYCALEDLQLDNCHLTLEGIRPIATALPLSNIRILDVGYNEFGNEGMELLAEALPHSSIVELTAGFSNGSEDGTKTLLKALPEGQLAKLGVYGEECGETMRGLLDAAAINNRNFAMKEWKQRDELTSDRLQILGEKIDLIRHHLRHKEDANEAEIDAEILAVAERAAEAGLPELPRYVVRIMPFAKACEWLEARGKSVTASDFLTADGRARPNGNLNHLAHLCQHPDFWESRTQATTAIRSLPEAVQAILPTHQLLATLSRRDATKQQGRG